MIKSFVLIRDEQNKPSYSEDIDNTKGTSFLKGQNYVDYKSLKKGITLTLITEVLIDKGFLKPISQVKL